MGLLTFLCNIVCIWLFIVRKALFIVTLATGFIGIKQAMKKAKYSLLREEVKAKFSDSFLLIALIKLKNLFFH